MKVPEMNVQRGHIYDPLPVQLQTWTLPNLKTQRARHGSASNNQPSKKHERTPMCQPSKMDAAPSKKHDRTAMSHPSRMTAASRYESRNF